MFKRLKITDYDFRLIALVIAINTIGNLAVGSANPLYVKKELLGSILGFFLMVVVSLFDYNVILKFHWLWYFICCGLLGAVLLGGSSSHNATRWFVIAGIKFQPSETAKIMLIIFFATFIMKYREKINSLVFLVSYFVLCAIPMGLIYKQPDMSTTIVIAVILITMLFVSGISWKLVIGAITVAIPASIVFLSMILKEDQTLLEPYQRKRVLSFFYPEKYVDNAYQQANSVIAIGSGGLLGKGLNNNEITSLKNGRYIIEPETDFIFSVIGEEMGFIGCMAVIIILFLIVIECFLIARRVHDAAGRAI
ncbi:MAG: FtsW/RodA/SpoVE family cell cycle protein, partial [Lachnospiraceae bacterium]|nr:FtsW/RodA/SpoVE family cell cycle protein [Lachnospiraceae bacterium]